MSRESRGLTTSGPGGRVLELRGPVLADPDCAYGPTGDAHRDGIGRDVPIDERARTDHGALADGDATTHDRLASDVREVSDRDRAALRGFDAGGDGPPNRVMRVDLDSGADAATFADRQAAAAVEESEWPDPGVAAHLHVAVDVAVVIDARPVPEPETARPLPPIEQQLLQRQVAVPPLPHVAAQRLV